MRWDLLAPFPEQNAQDREIGDAACNELAAFLRDRVDPTAIDESRQIPDDVVEELRKRGYHRLLVPAAHGGRGLSYPNVFRVVETAASWSTPLAAMIANANGFGSGAYLPLVPDGGLRDRILRHVADGTFSGGADAESHGSGSERRRTTATLSEDGAEWTINGEKLYIINGLVADLLDVTATVRGDGPERVSAFFVDTSDPGFEVLGRQDFLGLNGATTARLRLTGVRTPRDHELVEAEVFGSAQEMRRLIYRARTLSVAPASLAITRLCLHWSRDFVNRREINGRPLGSYQEIQRIVAENVADALAVETLARWTLLATGADTLHEHAALKNVASLTCWRAVDRTLGLLGAEGFETAASKARRGAPPLPVERYFRDARGLRIMGGVDFQVDNWSAMIRLSECYYDGGYRPAAAGDGPAGPVVDGRLRAHRDVVDREAAAFGRMCREVTAAHPDRATLFARQHLIITLNRIANELLTMAVVLARAGGDPALAGPADVYCRGARRRLAELHEELTDGDHATVAREWLAGARYPSLLDDVITGTPPAR